MNLYCIVDFVICLTNIMNMAVIIIFLNGIHMMDIHLVLLTKRVRTLLEMTPGCSRIAPEDQDALEQLQRPQNSSRTTFANPVTIPEQYPHQQSCRQATIHHTVPEHCVELLFRKARGQNTVHSTVP